jgi:hypothetical protein
VASALADASFDARLRAANAAAASAYDAEAARAASGAVAGAAARVRHEYPRAEAEAALGRKASPGAKKTGSRVVSRPEHETSSKKEETSSRKKASSTKSATTSKRVSKKVSHDSKHATTSKRDDDFKRLVLGETEKEGLLAVSRAHAVCTKPLGNAFLGQTGFDEVIKRRLFEIHYKHEEQLAAGADAAAAIGMRPRGGAGARTGPSGDGGIAKPGSVWAHAEIIDSYREVQRQMEEVKAAADRARVAAATPKVPAERARHPMEFDGADYDADARGDVAWTPAATRRWERDHGDYVGAGPRRPETPAERDARRSAQMFDYESPILDN